MKKLIIPVCFMILLGGCKNTNEHEAVKPVESPSITKEMVMQVTRDYLKNRVKNPIVSEVNGVCRVLGLGEIYVLEISGVTIGNLDADDLPDAIMSCIYEETSRPVITRHFVLTGKDSLHVVTSIDSKMKIFDISNQMLSAEISTRSNDDPGLAPCNICTDTVFYRLEGDSLKLQ